LEVALDGVHGDDEVIRLPVSSDVLQADECFSFLWLPNDGAQVLGLLYRNIGHPWATVGGSQAVSG